jgi:hypothetical protein
MPALSVHRRSDPQRNKATLAAPVSHLEYNPNSSKELAVTLSRPNSQDDFSDPDNERFRVFFRAIC